MSLCKIYPYANLYTRCTLYIDKRKGKEMKNYFRLQDAGIEIDQMRSFTSDYSNDAEIIEEDDFDSFDDYAAAVAAQADGYSGTICVADSISERAWGGIRSLLGKEIDGYEVIVLNGRKAFSIYDGVRLYSETLTEVARFSLEAWEQMQDDGSAEQYDDWN